MESLNENEYLQENYIEIIPGEYAEDLKLKFQNNRELWYQVIVPKNKADELYVKTGNDYSKIWHEHCSCCFKSIDKNTKEICYASIDKLTWLCKDCYEEIFCKS